MKTIQQGDILHLSSPSVDILVLSKDFFNRTGMVIACPLLKKASKDALHIPVTADGFTGIALLEQLRSLDTHARFYKSVSHLSFEQIQNISDAAQGIFDYYPFSI